MPDNNKNCTKDVCIVTIEPWAAINYQNSWSFYLHYDKYQYNWPLTMVHGGTSKAKRVVVCFDCVPQATQKNDVGINTVNMVLKARDTSGNYSNYFLAITTFCNYEQWRAVGKTLWETAPSGVNVVFEKEV